MQYIKDQFYNVKQYLLSSNSNVIKKYFSLLGYKYNSIIPNNNFFHFATEAYIITILKEAKEEILEAELYMNVLSNDIEEEEYFENIDILMGNSNNVHNEVKLSSDKLAKLFLSFINYQKDQVKRQIDKEDLDTFFRKAVNYTLNKLNNDEDEEKSLDLYDIYMKVKQREHTLDTFIEEYKNYMMEKSKTKALRFCVQNPCEVFYYFCQVDYKELLKDIQYFNQQSSSVIYLGIALFKAQLNSQTNKLKNLYNYSHKNYSNIKNEIVNKSELVKSTCMNKLYLVNKFISEKYDHSKDQIKENYPSVYNKLSHFNEQYVIPIHNKISIVTDDSYSFIINKYSKGKENFNELKDKITKKVAEIYDVSYEKAKEYVHLSVDKLGKLGVVQICYDKVKTSKTEFYNLLNHVHGYVKDFNLEQLKSLAKDTYNQGKKKMIESYEKFLGITERKKVDEPNQESKEVISG